MTTCPQCGEENFPGMAYCEHCGAPLTAPEAAPAPAQGGDPSAAQAIAQAQAVLDQVGGDADQAAPDSQDGGQATGTGQAGAQAVDAGQDTQADAVEAVPQSGTAQASPANVEQPAPAGPTTGIPGEAQPVEAVKAALSLTITFGDGSVYTIQNDVTNVGRSDIAQNWHPELDVIPFGGGAPDLGVSRHQAVIQRNGTSFSVLDVGSTNGTFVNGRVLEYNKPTELHDGDTIAFGAFNARVSIK
jgi:FHA domain